MSELQHIVRRVLANSTEARKDDSLLIASVWAVEWDDKKGTAQDFFIALSRKKVSTVLEILEARQTIINELN